MMTKAAYTLRGEPAGIMVRTGTSMSTTGRHPSETHTIETASRVKRMTKDSFEAHQADRMEHEYHDYSNVAKVPVHIAVLTETRGNGGVADPFPTILHKLLSEADRMGFSHIISWQPHGRCFMIHNPREFVHEVVSRYFKLSKLSSFQRQLSLYGFRRLSRGSPDKGSYYHELFLRGRSTLCRSMQRTRVKGTWVRSSASPELEPDFYSMGPVLEDADENNEWTESRPQIDETSSLELSREQVSRGESLVPSTIPSDEGIVLDQGCPDPDLMQLETHLSDLRLASDRLAAEGDQDDDIFDMLIASLPLLQPSKEEWNYPHKTAREQANGPSVGRTTSFPLLSSSSELTSFFLDMGLATRVEFEL